MVSLLLSLAFSPCISLSRTSLKAVWRFEPVEELTAGMVSFNEPMRLRHVATNLFLAVDLLRPAVKVRRRAAVHV
jgi:hypothetical protein